MKKKFSIELSSDLDFEGMVVDISYDMQPIASLNYEKGIEKIEIEMQPNARKLAFPIEEFFHILHKAKELAVKCAKEDEDRKNS